ncbi:hypothetical protein ACIOWB_25175 [Pseudomonas capeferrum]|uniref:hypothetical protein n=1 Tax=Pseudomonas capeferrum TaxID=1495066 RepID=UPI00383073CC
MTAIAGFEFRGTAFLYGDIIATAPVHPGFPHVEVPTYLSDDGSGPISGGRGVSGLYQKIILLSESCAIACTGRVDEIVSIIHEFRKLPSEKLTGTVMLRMLEEDTELKIYDVGVIILTVEDSKPVITAHNVTQIDSALFENAVAAGSGVEAFEKYLYMYGENPLGEIAEDEIVVYGTCAVLFQFSLLLHHEFNKQDFSDTFYDHFGGGYELIAFYDGKLQKINNALYVFCKGLINSDGFLSVDTPSLLIKQEHIDSELYIRSVHTTHKSHNESADILSDRTFLIPPIHHINAKSQVVTETPIELTGEFLCLIVDVEYPDNHVARIPYIRKFSSPTSLAEQAFHPEVAGDKLSFQWQEKISNELPGYLIRALDHWHSN